MPIPVATPVSLPEALRQRLAPLKEQLHCGASNTVVPFVGSGLSRGLLSWNDLLVELLSFAPAAEQAELRAEIDRGRYLEVADVLAGMSEVGPARIREVIARAYRQPGRERPAVYDAVAALPTAHFITSNYDPWLKDAVSAQLKRAANVVLPGDGPSLGHLSEPMPWVFHLHGDAAKPETCVLTARDYRRLLSGSPAWRAAVKTLLSSRHLLLLGSSLSEPHLGVLLDKFEQDFQPEGGRRRHWWLGKVEGQVEVRRLQRLGIEVVDYRSHDLLPELLRWLASPPTAQALKPMPARFVASTEFDITRPWFFMPFQPKGADLIGGEEALEQVRAELSRGRPTAIGHAAAFTGLGGIGKTQLAVEHCWRRRADYPGGVYWFIADQDIESQVLRLVDEAGWLHPSTDHATKLQIGLNRLRTVRDALFVFDNLERSVAAADLRPSPGPGNQVLLTSRLEQPAFQQVRVALLDLPLARALLESEAGRTPEGPGEEAAADTICRSLDGLPLAIELAGAYLRRRTSRSFQEYAELLKRKGIDDTARAEPRFPERSATAHEANLANTLRIAGPLLEEHPGLEQTLDILAWSASASMGWSLLVQLVDPADPDVLRDGVDLAEALRVLRLERGARDGAEPRFRMHRLVKEVRRRERPLLSSGELARMALGRIAPWFEARRLDFSDLDAYEAELDHLDAWIAAADALVEADARAQLRWLRAYPAWHRGEYERSLREIDEALRVFEHLSLEDRLLEAHLKADRGVIWNQLGRHAQALADAEWALTTRKDLLGERHLDTANSYHNVGSTYGALGDHLKALEFLTRALDLRRELLGELHPDTANTYNNVGSTYGALGEYRKALEFLTRALDLRRELLGERHPDTATTYNNVGSNYGALGEYHKALEFKTRALDLCRELLGERHPDTATTYDNLGTTHGALGDHHKALEFLTRALDIRRELLGERHPHTATSYNNIGSTHSALGDHSKALEFKTRALDIRRELLGERHPHTAASYNNIGSTHSALGDHSKALEFMTRALGIRRELLGERHPTTATSYDNVGSTHGALGDHLKALEFQTRAFNLKRELLGERHPDTVRTGINVLITMQKLG